MANKTTKNFKKVIQEELERRAEESIQFAASFTKKDKNIDECINYILNTVQKSGVNGFTDDEIFGIAMHYYDEDDIKSSKAPDCNVIVNHTVTLTEKEIAEAKKKAIDKVIFDQKQRMTKKAKKQISIEKKNEELTLF